MVSENHESAPETSAIDAGSNDTGPFRTEPKIPAPTEGGHKPNSADSAGTDSSPDEVTQFQEALHARLVDAIKTVYDPEIPVDIYELGLIYEIEINEEASVTISMTLTSPACPVAGALVAEVEEKVAQTEGVKASQVELVWDPPWTPDLMSESAKLELGMM
jgi:FeS assembly SUF system protein